MNSNTQATPESAVPRQPDLSFRMAFVNVIAKIVGNVGCERRLDHPSTLQIRAEMIHKLVHRNFRFGIEDLHTYRYENKLYRIAERLIDRELRRRAKARATSYGLEPLDGADCQKILKKEPRLAPMADLLNYVTKVWCTLDSSEQTVLRLHDLALDSATISGILETTVKEAEALLDRTKAKVRRAYEALRN